MQTWFITGTSTGIGRHLAEQLLERGERVAATARSTDALADLAEHYGDRVWLAALDVTDTAAIRSVVDRAFAELGRVDVIVSNAGYGLTGAAEELTDDAIVHQIDTNLIGSIQLMRAVLPHLRAQNGGRFIQLSSMGGQMTLPGLSLYHATKWGIEGFLESVIPEVAPFNIGITLVEPGSVRTEFGGRSMGSSPRIAAYDASIPWLRNLAPGENRSLRGPGDPAKIAAAIIASAAQSPAPKRLTLGSDAYRLVGAALHERIAALESARDLAYSTDADDVVHG
jgi:NAD(P)-dependent dehydrogenase (short-subunit alcohol dehydrogenase family)